VLDFCEYTTVHEVRNQYLGSEKTKDDRLLLGFIRQVSREIKGICKHEFYPHIETRTYDTPVDTDLYLDGDLIKLIKLNNGGELVDVTKPLLYNLNSPTKHFIRLLPSVGIWKTGSSGTSYAAIEVTGEWGFVLDRTAGWDFADTLPVGMDDSVKYFKCNTGEFYAGQLLQIGDEILYVKSTVDDPVDGNLVNVIRGANGSTSSIHSVDNEVSAWNPGYDIRALSNSAVAAYYYLKSNPVGSSYTQDGVTFETPKDVIKFMTNRLLSIGAMRVGFG
jgi:hypothetical protein